MVQLGLALVGLLAVAGIPLAAANAKCPAGFGGEDCTLSLDLLQSVPFEGKGGARALQNDVAAVPEGQLAMDPLGGQGGDGSTQLLGADGEVDVPSNLRKMLLYAQHLSETAAGEDFQVLDGAGRHLQQAASSETGVGCGFYDVFYEGCMPCFYNQESCEAENPFYDFYMGTIPHAPTVEYSDKFSGVVGDRGDRTPAKWSGPFSPEKTILGEHYLEVPAMEDVRLAVDGLPGSFAEVSVSFDVLVTDDTKIDNATIGAAALVSLTVLGDDIYMPVSATKGAKYLVGMPNYHLNYVFNYSTSNIHMKLSPNFGVTWGIDNFQMQSLVGNFVPTVEDRDVQAIPDQAVTIELRGKDKECDALTYMVTSLPTEGTLFLCSCDNIWTTPITAAHLPMVVPGPCQRVVYVPPANEPKADNTRTPYDMFTYAAADSFNTTSGAGKVSIYMQVEDAEGADTPVAGAAGLALSFNGLDDVLSLSRTATTVGADSLWTNGKEMTIDLRFKLLGDSEGGMVLAERKGMFFLGWTAPGVLTFVVYNVNGSNLVAVANAGYADRYWHHVTAVLETNDGGNSALIYVDGELVARTHMDSLVSSSESAASAVTTFGGSAAPDATSAFHGYLDEVRLWGFGWGDEDVKEYLALGTWVFTGAEEGLVTYLTFNEGPAAGGFAYDKSPARNDGILGRLAEDGLYDGKGSQPAFVSSGAPFGNVVSTLEDEAVVVPLFGGDLEGGVTYYIATLPLLGRLYTTKDGVTRSKRIETSPFALPASGPAAVVYVPAADGNGAPYDIFKYQTFDGSEFSYRQGVLINVHPVEDTPTVEAITATMDEKDVAKGYKLVPLVGDDPDGMELSFMVTTLPALGALYHVEDGEPVGDAISAPGTRVTTPVAYFPLANAEGTPYDQFGFKVFAGDRASSDALVTVDIPFGGPAKPVAGEAGYALFFDGVNDVAVLGNVSDYLDLASHSCSVELWFKTGALALQMDVTLLSAGPLSIRWSKVDGLYFQAGEAVAATAAGFNDGAWHYLSATLDGLKATLSVDAMPAATAMLAAPLEASSAPIMLGMDAQYHYDAYKGLVDGVSFWAWARSADEVNATALLDLSGKHYQGSEHPKMPTALFQLNEAAGNHLTEAVSGAVLADALGSVEGAQPQWVPSTVPYANEGFGVEEQPFTLHFAVSSESGVVPYPACVLAAPSAGALYTAAGDEITSYPATVKGGSTWVAGPQGVFGEAAIAITYVGGDCEVYDDDDALTKHAARRLLQESDFYGIHAMQESLAGTEVSAAVTFTISLEHVNHAPTACMGEETVSGLAAGEYKDLLITLPAADVDGMEELEVHLTYLPYNGYLSTVEGEIIASPGFALKPRCNFTQSEGCFFVLYTPQLNFKGGSDAFGFKATDGMASTAECVATVDVDDAGLSSDLPISGDAGYALEFGVEQTVSLGSTFAYAGAAASMTTALFFKSSAALADATLSRNGPFTIGWTPATGLYFAVSSGGVTATIPTYHSFTDGFWHFVSASYFTNGTMVFEVDAEWSMTAVGPAYPLEIAADAEFVVGEHFVGTIDEFSVWYDTALANITQMAFVKRSMLVDAYGSLPVGLVGHWSFNDLEAPLNSTVPVMGAEMASGVAGQEGTSPTPVVSTLPMVGDNFEVVEDQRVVVNLVAGSQFGADAMYVLTKAPVKGDLVVARTGKKLKKNSKVAVGEELHYVVRAYSSGQDTFTYLVEDEYGSSPATPVGVMVHHVNHRPSSVDAVVAIDFAAAELVEVELKGVDPDAAEDLAIVVTYLPTSGTLYQGVEDGHGVMEVDTANFRLNATGYSATLFYKPMLNLAGKMDSFGFLVVDKEGLMSTESVVTLDGADSSSMDAGYTPTAGAAGMALMFDGLSQSATLGSLDAFNITTSGAFSLWFRTSASSPFGMNLLSTKDFSLGWAPMGLAFSAGSITALTSMQANDGKWHHVMASFDAVKGVAMIDVDGVAVAKADTKTNKYLQKQPIVITAPDGLVVIGGESAGTAYHGQIDDVEISNSLMVTGFFRFNEAAGGEVYDSAQGVVGMLGKNGMEETQPTRVTSTAPIADLPIEIIEDTPVDIQLHSTIVDAEAHSFEGEFYITQLPKAGELFYYRADGSFRLVRAPMKVPTDMVRFVPEQDGHALGLTYATFAYTIVAAGAQSFEAVQAIRVVPVNDRPVLAMADSITAQSNTPVEIAVGGGVDDELSEMELTYMVTTLPAEGLLKAADGSLVEAGKPLQVGTVLTYLPPANAHGHPFVTIGLAAHDGFLMSQEVSLKVNVDGNAGVVMGGNTGFTVKGSGLIDSASEFSALMWYHPTAMEEADAVNTLLSSVSSKLEVSVSAPVARYSHGAFAADMAAQAAPSVLKLALNQWHHIAVVLAPDAGGATTFSGKYLYVDGKLVAARGALASGPAVADPEFTIGSHYQNSVQGIVDDVSIWSYGLKHHEILSVAAARLSGSEQGLVAYFPMDEVSRAGKFFPTPRQSVSPNSTPEIVGGLEGVAHVPLTVTSVSAPFGLPSSEALKVAPLYPGSGSMGSAGMALSFNGDDLALEASLPAHTSLLKDFTVQMWFRTGANTQDNMGLVTFTGDVYVAWDKVMGLGVQFGESWVPFGTLSAPMFFNDGAWHHLSVSFQHFDEYVNVPTGVQSAGQYTVTITVDEVTVSTPNVGMGQILEEGMPKMIVGDAPMCTPFSGVVDEVKLFTGVRNDTSDRFVEVSGSDPTLLVYFKFSQAYGAEVNSSAVAFDASATLTGSASSMMNAWVTSTAPVDSMPITVEEDSDAVLVSLVGMDSEGSDLELTLHSIPAVGHVFDINLTEITAEMLPYTGVPSKMVLYAPPAHFYGGVHFKYTLFDGRYTSEVIATSVVVTPVNDAPYFAADADAAFAVRMNTGKVLVLPEAVDHDEDAVAYMITTVPVQGSLYQYNASAFDLYGAMITDVNTPVEDGARRLWYLPATNMAGVDSFGIAAGDAGAMSAEFKIEVQVNDAQAKPTAGAAGLALVANISAEGTTNYGAVQYGDYALTTFTYDFWVKTSAMMDENDVLLWVNETYQVRFLPSGELALIVEATSVGTGILINDGAWHHVAFARGADTVTLFVDMQLAATAADPYAGVSLSYTYVAGFHGLFDELRLWEGDMPAANPTFLAEFAARLVMPGFPGLLSHYPFDNQVLTGVVEDYAGPFNMNVEGALTVEGSTAPVDKVLFTGTEDTQVVIPLVGTSSAGDRAFFVITTLPAKGSLYDSSDLAQPITQTPYLISGDEVTFAPEPNEHDLGGTPYASFIYATADDAESGVVFSVQSAPVQISILNANDPPAIEAVVPAALNLQSFALGKVTVTAADYDLLDPALRDGVYFAVTALPTGVLYQVAPDGSTGDRVVMEGTRIEHVTFSADGKATATLLYEPDLETYSTSFDVVVGDNATASAPETVAVAVTHDPHMTATGHYLTVPRTAQISTVAGFALELSDASTSFVSVDSASFNAAFDDAPAVKNFTLELLMKSDAEANLANGVALVKKEGMFALEWTPDSGITFTLFGDAQNMDASGNVIFTSVTVACDLVCDLNDGYWHHVAGTYNSITGVASLVIDGVVMGAESMSVAAFGTQPYMTSTDMTISADAASSFTGLVDEVRVWNVERSEAEIAATMGASLSGMPGLVASFKFGQASVVDDGRKLQSTFFRSGTAATPTNPASSAPIFMQQVYLEGEKDIQLYAATELDIELTMMVTNLPVNGTLYTADGMLIAAVPYLISTPAKSVTYVPTAVGLTDKLGYIATDGMQKSYEGIVYIEQAVAEVADVEEDAAVEEVDAASDAAEDVTPAPVDDRRQLIHLDPVVVNSTVVVLTPVDTLVTLEAEDAAGELMFTLGALPTSGELFVTYDGVTRGLHLTMPQDLEGGESKVQISSNGTLYLLYSPFTMDTMMAPLGAVEEMLQWNATGASSTYMGSVLIVGDNTGVEQLPPLAGISGNALVVTGGAGASVPAGDSALEIVADSFSVELFVKVDTSQSTSTMQSTLLVSQAGYAIYVHPDTGVTFSLYSAAETGAVRNFDIETEVQLSAEWHFIAATWNASTMTGKVYIDSLEDEVVSRTYFPSTDDDTFPLEMGSQVVLGPTTVDYAPTADTSVPVLVDNLRLYNVATPFSVAMGTKDYAPEPTYPGLVGLWTFDVLGCGDAMLTLCNTVAREDASSMQVTEEMYLVVSGAPLLSGYMIQEEETAMVTLPVFGSNVVPYLTRLPADGKVFLVSDGVMGVEIAFVPAAIPSGTVMYVPGTNLAMEEDSLAYVAYAEESEQMSAVAGVSVLRTFFPRPPALTFYTRNITTSTNEPVMFKVLGKTAAGKPASIHILELPKEGILYQATEDGAIGERVNSVPIPVANTQGNLFFVPAVNGHGFPYDSVQVAAFANGMYSELQPVMNMSVAPNLALVFRNTTDLEVFDGVTQPAHSYTLALRVKVYDNSNFTAIRHRNLLQQESGTTEYLDFITDGMFPRSQAPFVALQESVGKAPMTFDDELWHYIAAVFDEEGKMKEVYVDAKLDSPAGFAYPEVHTMTFNTGAGAQEPAPRQFATFTEQGLQLGGFLGEVDGVYLFGMALDAHALGDLMKLSGDALDAFLTSKNMVFGTDFEPDGPGWDRAKYKVMHAPVAGPAGYALQFDGSQQATIVDAPALSFNDTMSVGMWFKTSGVLSDATLVQKNDTAQDLLMWSLKWMGADGLTFAVTNTANDTILAHSGQMYDDNAWHLVVGVFDSNTAIISVDGERMGTVVGAVGLKAPADEADCSVFLGVGNFSDPNSYFTGTMEELMIFNHSLSDSSLLAMVGDSSKEAAFLTGAEEQLVSWWRYNEASGQGIFDSQDPTLGTRGAISMWYGEETMWTTSTVPLRDVVSLPLTEQDVMNTVDIKLYGADEDGDALAFVIVTLPALGYLAYEKDGKSTKVFSVPTVVPDALTYTYSLTKEEAKAAPEGLISTLQYQVSDGSLYSDLLYGGTVSIVALMDNVPPVAFNMSVTTAEDTPIDIALNVSDADGDTLVVYIDSLPFEGTLSVTASKEEITRVPFALFADDAGNFTVTYTPLRSYLFKCVEEPALFGFYAKDPSDAESALAFVNVSITLVNDPPAISVPSKATTLTVYPATRSTLLTPIVVFDPDLHHSAESMMSVQISSQSGTFTVPGSDNTTSTVNFEGKIVDITRSMNLVMYNYVDPSAAGSDVFLDLITVAVSDNGYFGEGVGPTLTASLEMPVTYYQNPNVVNAMMNADNTFDIMFAEGVAPVDPAADCSAYILDESISDLGESPPLCTWAGSTLTVRMGAHSYLEPGAYVKFHTRNTTTSLASGWNGDVLNIVVNRAPLDSTSVPTALIDGPKITATCDMVALSGIYSENALGRNFTYFWELVSVDGEAPPECLRIAATQRDYKFHSFPSERPYFVIPAEFTVPGEYNVSLVVANFLGAFSEPVYQIITVVEEPVPRIQIMAAPGVQSSANVDFYQTTKMRISDCMPNDGGNATYNVSYAWTFDPAFGTPVSTTNSAFRVPSGDISVGNWSISVMLTVCVNGTDVCYSASDSLAFEILPSPAVVVIKGGDYRTVTHEGEFELDGTWSYDPNDHVNELTYEWSCATASGGSCGDSWYNSMPQEGVLTIKPESGNTRLEANREYDFTLTAVTTQGSKSHTQRVKVEPRGHNRPQAHINWMAVGSKFSATDDDLLLDGFVDPSNRKSKDASITYQWSVADGSTDALCDLLPECNSPPTLPDLSDTALVPDGLSTSYLKVVQGNLAPGAYRFQVLTSYSCGSTTPFNSQNCEFAMSNILVVVNAPPEFGVAAVQPNTEVNPFDTDLHYFVDLWEDVDVPLSYSFGIETLDGTVFKLRSDYSQTAYVSKVPGSTKNALIWIQDSLGASTMITMPVEMNAYETNAQLIAGIRSAVALAEAAIAVGDSQGALIFATMAIADLNSAAALGLDVDFQAAVDARTSAAAFALEMSLDPTVDPAVVDAAFLAIVSNPSQLSMAAQDDATAYMGAASSAARDAAFEDPSSIDLGRVADLFDICGYLFRAPNSDAMMAMLEAAMATPSVVAGQRKLLGSQDNFALLNTNVDVLSVTALLAIPAGAFYKTHTTAFNIDAAWLPSQLAYDGSMMIGHHEFPVAMTYMAADGTAGTELNATATTVYYITREYLQNNTFFNPYGMISAALAEQGYVGEVVQASMYINDYAPNVLPGDPEALLPAELAENPIVVKLERTGKLPIGEVLDGVMMDLSNPSNWQWTQEGVAVYSTDCSMTNTKCLDMRNNPDAPENGGNLQTYVQTALTMGAITPAYVIAAPPPPIPTSPPPATSPPVAPTPVAPTALPPRSSSGGPLVLADLTEEEEAGLGTGLGVGIVLIFLLIAYVIYQRRRAEAMKQRLAAEMDGEMLEVQGLMGQEVQVAGSAPFAIRAPVGGAMRTAAMLESDRMDNKI